MLLYRITHKQFSQSLVAPGFGGRWNSEGKNVIYTAESIPLAFLESMLRRQGVGFNRDFNTMIIEVPDTLPHRTSFSLAPQTRSYPAPAGAWKGPITG